MIIMMKSRRIRWAGNVVRVREKTIAYGILVGILEENRPLGTARRRQENNIKMDFRETRWNVMKWIDLSQDRDQCRALVNTVVYYEVP
jgi:hypothetical protein